MWNFAIHDSQYLEYENVDVLENSVAKRFDVAATKNTDEFSLIGKIVDSLKNWQIHSRLS